MLTSLRLAVWVFAVFFAVSPVMLGIATAPQNAGRLLLAESYAASGRDLIAGAIAVLAIGLIDSLEAVLLLWNRRRLWYKIIFAFTFILLLAILVQLFFYAYWSGRIEVQIATADVWALITLVVLAATSALFARVMLIASTAG
jgi:hypothetical protein